MKLQRAIDIYLERCKETKSFKTWKGYRGRLKTLGEMHGKKRIEDLKPKHIEKWIEKATHWRKGHAKAGQPKADHTIRLTVIAWEQVQKLMLEKGWIDEEIFDYGPKPGGRKRTRIPTLLEQALVFREALRKGWKEFALIFHCLRLCGARPGELVAANIGDYNLDDGCDLIELKEHKTAKKTQTTRKIGVGTVMRRRIAKSIGERTEGPLFLDEKGNRWTPEKLSRKYRTLRDKLRLSKDLVLYSTRHEHGTRICEKHGIAIAKDALGHSDIATTQRYVHLNPKKLATYQDSL